jgi:hypothetical protein
MAFEAFPDATRVLAVLGKRLARYGLTLHPDKTRLIDFRFKRPEGTHHPAARGTTFDFLGFTHVWGKSRKGVNVQQFSFWRKGVSPKGHTQLGKRFGRL